MSREADSALQLKILQIGFLLTFLGAILYGVRGMMFGSKSIVGIVAGFSVISAAVFALDREYWVLYPLISSSGLFIPGLPFASADLGCILLVSVFCVRSVLRRDSLHVETLKYVLWAAPYFLWCALVFCLNPVGLHMFGSTMIGGRHYFHLALGFATLFVLSQIELSERGLRLLFVGLIISAFVRTGLGAFGVLEEEETLDLIRSRSYLESFGIILSYSLSTESVGDCFISWIVFCVPCLCCPRSSFRKKINRRILAFSTLCFSVLAKERIPVYTCLRCFCRYRPCDSCGGAWTTL